MRVLVVGLGTIGGPFARLCLALKDKIGIEELFIHKNTPNEGSLGSLLRFLKAGAHLTVYKEKKPDFADLLAPYVCWTDDILDFESALDRVDIVVDCTAEKIGRAMKAKYYIHRTKTIKGFIAQGSENGFGIPYAFGINDEALESGREQFVQTASCNTHGIVRLIKTLALDYGGQNLVTARIVLCRRASDISQTESTVGVEIGVPRHLTYGSHQGEDAARIFATMNIHNLNLHAVADKTNNSFMHILRFNITLRERIDRNEVLRRFQANPLIALTHQLTNNQSFSEGREWGHFGRILNQIIVCVPSLEVIGGHEVIGACFIPQDGNSLLSSTAAMLWYDNPETYAAVMEKYLLKPPFIFDEV